MAEADTLRIRFNLRGLPGSADASLSRNTDPDSLGYRLLSGGEPVDFAKDFPVCHAVVTYPADGYAAMFGWTQMVRSGSDWEMDPIAIYSDVATPFAWYGLKPVLFDAPCRVTRPDMDWEAQSFLCVSPDAVLTTRVQAIAGFSWGFTVRDERVTFTPLKKIGPEAWDGQLSLLRGSYPKWTFDPGYLGA
jgi:hypothetical protein